MIGNRLGCEDVSFLTPPPPSLIYRTKAATIQEIVVQRECVCGGGEVTETLYKHTLEKNCGPLALQYVLLS